MAFWNEARRWGRGAAAAVVMAGLLAASPSAVATDSETGGIVRWAGVAGAVVTGGDPVVAVASSGLPGSAALTGATRPAGSAGALFEVAVRGTASSIGDPVRAVVIDTATGQRTVSAPLHLQPWWQTLGVRAASTSSSLQVGVEEVAGGWRPGDAYSVSSAAVAASGPIPSSVSGRRLFRNGNDYVIHGYNYGAVPIGGSGLPRTEPVIEWSSNPEHCATDANLMKVAGVNSVRISYLLVVDDNARQCMDMFAANDVGFLWLINGPYSYQNSTVPGYEAAFSEELTRFVAAVKDHPVTLGYVLGNENNRTEMAAQPAWFAMLDRLAGQVKTDDPNHVVTSSLTHGMFFGEGTWPGVSPTMTPNVDLWAINMYGTATGYASSSFASIVSKDSSRPVWFSEYGTDRYWCTMHPPGFLLQVPLNWTSCKASLSYENPHDQATWDVAAWQDIEANLSSASNPNGAMVGAALFMWSDSWWFSFPFFTGPPTTTTVTHDLGGVNGVNPITGEPSPFIQRSMPDQHFSPEWQGTAHAMRIEQNGPRVTALAYDGMASEHTGTPSATVSGVSVATPGACKAVITFATSTSMIPRVDFGQVLEIVASDIITADNTVADLFVQGTSPATSHTITLKGLTPATTYRAFPRGFTTAGRPASSAGIEFTTPAAGNNTCNPNA